MDTNLYKWLSHQNDIEESALRFLKNGEYTSELNHFFELKNKVPIAVTGFGALIYAESLYEEQFFFIYYPDRDEVFPIADSLQELDQFFKDTGAPNYEKHITYCQYSQNKHSYIKELINKLGQPGKGEIIGYADEYFDESRGRSVSKSLILVMKDKAAIRNAMEYYAKLIARYDKTLEIYDNTIYLYNHISGRARCFSETNRIFRLSWDENRLIDSKYIQYFEFRGYYTSKVKNILSMLKQHHYLLRIYLLTSPSDLFKTGPLENLDDLLAFPHLRAFILENTPLPYFPEELTQLKNLEFLYLMNTGIKQLSPAIANLTQLKQLRISHTPLDGQVDVIGELKNLQWLSLIKCGLTQLPDEFRHLTNLEYLDLTANPLTEIPEWIGELTKLKEINFTNCRLESLPQSIGELKHIDFLEVKGNTFKTLPKSLLKLKTKVKIEPKFKALYDEKTRKKLEELGQKPAVFTDFGFKLMVIQSLMYDQELLGPKFDAYEFVANYKERKIDIEEEGYDMIPELKAWFEKLEIPIVLLDEIDELDAGNMDVYAQISPRWGGEDDFYNVRSAKDAKQLPNLKKITLLYTGKDGLLGQFEKLGIEAEWV